LPALLLDHELETGIMAIRPIDTLLAIKVINLMPGLRQSDRQVGVTLIEHFNRRTGRCDPGIKRIASLLGYCERTVIRSIQRLEAAGLFLKTRHGGYSNRNRYEPNWPRFAEHEAAWKTKLRKSAS
jgi:biotin operon repressor